MRWLAGAASLALALAICAQQAAQQKQGQPGRGGRGGFGGVPPLEETGFRPIFDGKSMAGWDCDPAFWKVTDGVMTGETTAQHQPPQNIFCIWRAGSPADFDLRLQYRLSGADTGNSGIQFRSDELPNVAKWVLKGYQADIDAQQRFTGQIYEERGRGFLAMRGMFSYIPDGGKAGAVSSLGDANELKNLIKINDWNDIDIVARGNTIVQMINGRVTSMLIDDDKEGRKMKGLIGIQLHVTPGPMKIEARNIRLKDL
jgi:hypothetical protein